MESQSIKDRAPLNRARDTLRTVPACQWTITASETDVELRTCTGVPVLATGTGTVLPFYRTGTYVAELALTYRTSSYVRTGTGSSMV
jgi:hypothetical protein|eukprot:COSAG01_NODE_11428_length_1936_cov_3.733261_3_plen_87_part_00